MLVKEFEMYIYDIDIVTHLFTTQVGGPPNHGKGSALSSIICCISSLGSMARALANGELAG